MPQTKNATSPAAVQIASSRCSSFPHFSAVRKSDIAKAMKATKGKANPQQVNELLKKKLSS